MAAWMDGWMDEPMNGSTLFFPFRWLQLSSDANGPKELESGKFFSAHLSPHHFSFTDIELVRTIPSPPPLKLATHDTGQVFRPVMARQTSAVVSAGAVVYRLLTIVTGDAGHSRILEPPQIEGGSRGCRYDVLALIGVERDGPLPSQLAGRAQFRVTGRPVGVSVMITFPFIYWHW